MSEAIGTSSNGAGTPVVHRWVHSGHTRYGRGYKSVCGAALANHVCTDEVVGFQHCKRCFPVKKEPTHD